MLGIQITEWLGLPGFYDLFAYMPGDIVAAIATFLSVLFALAIWRFFKG